MPADILNDIYSFAEKVQSKIQWQEGDFVLVDNEVVQHSREPFVGNNRKVYASLLTN